MYKGEKSKYTVHKFEPLGQEPLASYIKYGFASYVFIISYYAKSCKTNAIFLTYIDPYFMEMKNSKCDRKN